MNSATACHEIEDCPGLYIDAFRAFSHETANPKCNFILTHYHGDHYNGLPKDFKYKGPALIHCTPVTAALLRNIHLVSSDYIVEHEYGETWTHDISHKSGDEANVTFYNANHCPGAAIVLIELPNDTCHLHTGDFRFHESMKMYSRLQRAVQNRKVGVVYLDTTYGHPKHILMPQEEAVDSIASSVASLIPNKVPTHNNTLVLLSCYSIGKEKVLWQVSQRTNQLIYVSERKYKMLECIQANEEHVSSQILTKCTMDASQSDVHVIPMGMAGEMWPFFQPNHRACADYAEGLDKHYDEIVAFLPTGWADSSNWNKKNAISRKTIKGNNDKQVTVEIRLVAYSEHSAFPELCSFVEFLRPRQVVPTVFSDENDKRKMEGYFRMYIDSSRAKQRFFQSMKNSSDNVGGEEKPRAKKGDASSQMNTVETTRCLPEPKKQKLENDATCDDEQVATLLSMGFNVDSARNALQTCGGNVQDALDILLKQQQQPVENGKQDKKEAAKSSKSSPTTIKAFFSPKSKDS